MRAGHFVFFAVTWLDLQMVRLSNTESLMSTVVPIDYGQGIVPIVPATVTTGNYPCDAAFQRAESDFMLPLVLAMLVSRQCAGCRRRSASTRNIPVPIPIPIPINSPVIAQTENIPYESCYDSIVGGDEIPWEEKIVRLESGDKVVSYDSGVVKVTSPNGDVEYTAVPWAGVGPKKKHVYVCDCDGGTLDVRNAEPL